ncbi:MAG: WbqC family protein [Bilifractor sp.]|jgi:hypothetical protein
MKVAIHQPYFMPYIAYWSLISSVDVFATADNYNYIKGGWINRNRILVNGDAHYFNIEVHHASQNKMINELELADIDVPLKLRQLEVAYGRAPHFREGMELMEKVFDTEEKNLANFLFLSIGLVCDYLEIDTKLIRTSDIEQDPSLKRADRIYDYCRKLGADTYYNAIGGTELYSFDEFAARGMKLGFIQEIPVECHQTLGGKTGEFIPHLSIIDVIMFNSREECRKMVQSYRVITE